MNSRSRAIKNLDIELTATGPHSTVAVAHWTDDNTYTRIAYMKGTDTDCESVYEWLCDTLTAGRHPFEACGQLIVTTVTDK